jgi:hypothetical protein
MIIIVNVPSSVAENSHRSLQEQVDVDINDNIDTVKVKITLIFTELDPDRFVLECGGRRCSPNETIL